MRRLPGTLSAWEALLPAIPVGRRARGRCRPPDAAEGPRRARVALLTGCVQSVVFGAHNRATARVLARNGCDVVRAATIRAAAARSTPTAATTRARSRWPSARSTRSRRRGVDAVVVNTSGCGAHMKAFGTLLAGEPRYARAREALRARRCRTSPSSWRASRCAGRSSPVPMTVTYHDPCHVVHGQKIQHAAARSCWPRSRAAARRAGGVRLVLRLGRHLQPHPARDGRRGSCIARSATCVATGAEAVVTANPGCILQIQAGLRAHGRDVNGPPPRRDPRPSLRPAAVTGEPPRAHPIARRSSTRPPRRARSAAGC